MSWFFLHVKCPHQSKLRTYLRVCMIILSKYNKFKVWNCRWSWSVFGHVCGLVFLSVGSTFNPKNYLQVSSNIHRCPSLVQWRKLHLHQVTYKFSCFLLLWPFTRIIIEKYEISWVCEVLTGTERVCVKIPTLCYINKHEMKTAVQRHSLLCWWWPNILKLPPAVNLGWNITIKHTMCDYKHFVGTVNPCVQ